MKKKNNNKTILILSLICFISLFAVGTYSWVSRSWTPKLEYSEITIATSGALVITMEDKDGDTTNYNEINLNELNNVDSFTLKQVSSRDGRNFYGADFNPALSGEAPIYSTDAEGKYIELEFYLAAQVTNDDAIKNEKYVFLHPETCIEYIESPVEEEPSTSEEVSVVNEVDSSSSETESSTSEDASLHEVENEEVSDVTKAIRMSIDAPGFNANYPYILCKGRDNDITGDGYDKIFTSTLFAAAENAIENGVGKPIFTDYPLDLSLNTAALTTQKCFDYTYFDGVDNRYLFKVSEDSPQKVTIRIWLEGCDENCVNEISGKTFKLVLKFDSIDVEDVTV